VTIGVGDALVLGVVDVGAEPPGTIGLGGVEVLVESESDEGVAGGGFWPLGMTMGGQPNCRPITKVPEFTATPPLPSMVAAAFPVTKPSLVKAVAAMFGTELMVILVSAALRCQPSSVSADWVTSATGRGSAAATPSAR